MTDERSVADTVPTDPHVETTKRDTRKARSAGSRKPPKADLIRPGQNCDRETPWFQSREFQGGPDSIPTMNRRRIIAVSPARHHRIAPSLPLPSPPEPNSQPCHRQGNRQNQSQPRPQVVPHGRTARRATGRKAGRKGIIPRIEVGADAEVPNKHVGGPAVSATNAKVGIMVSSHPRDKGPVRTGANERFIPAGPLINARPAHDFGTQINVVERVVMYPCPGRGKGSETELEVRANYTIVPQVAPKHDPFAAGIRIRIRSDRNS